MKWSRELLIECFLLFFSPLAWSLTSTTALNVGASVAETCTAMTTSNMAFGSYNPSLGLPALATSTINVTCALSLVNNFTVSLSVGTTPGATFANRLMANGAYTLSYNLYTSLLMNTIWGDSNGNGIATVSGKGLGITSVPLTVYGRIPAGQTNVASGNYSDTITATVTY